MHAAHLNSGLTSYIAWSDGSTNWTPKKYADNCMGLISKHAHGNGLATPDTIADPSTTADEHRCQYMCQYCNRSHKRDRDTRAHPTKGRKSKPRSRMGSQTERAVKRIKQAKSQVSAGSTLAQSCSTVTRSRTLLTSSTLDISRLQTVIIHTRLK